MSKFSQSVGLKYFMNFSVEHCSICLKRQSEHSGLCPDARSRVVLTLPTKFTEFCARSVFFLQTKFDFLLAFFDGIFLI